MSGLPISRYLQSQDNNTLWNINSNILSSLNNHDLILEVSGNNVQMNNYINSVNQATIGYKYFQLPKGTTSQRPLSVLQGYIRFNTTTKFLEYYNGTEWIIIASPPTLVSIFPTTVTQANFDISLSGGNFDSNSSVQFIGNNGTVYTSPQVTYINSRQVKAQTPSPALSILNEPYDVKIISSNSLSSILTDVLYTGNVPQFTTPAGSLGNIYDSFRTNGSYNLLDISASDPDGDPITYDICGGSLPTGLSLNSTTGVIGGTASAVVNTTTYNFTVRAVTANATTTRQFSITINQPQTITYSFNSSSYEQYFSIPSDLPGITVKMWGAGGGQYHSSTYGDVDGTGGPGGYSQSTINFLSGETTLTLVVGEGGNSNRAAGYGGGGGGYNGGAGGGGASLLISGSLSGTFQEVLTGTPYINGSIPQSNILNLNGGSGVIMVAGGGGGAGWYNTSDANGGCGGGINGSSNSGVYGPAGGGTQSSGGTGGGTGTGSGQGLGTSGTYLGGGYVTFNSSSGGSGGGGGGWYGGGAWQGNSGNNAGGGGGSGFVGFTDGTSPNKGTSGTLSENTTGTPIGYTDSITRTNGSRTYTNSVTLKTGNQTTGNGIFAPPYTGDIDYPGNKIGYGGEQTSNNSTLGENGKNGAIVIKY
jgi:hypothetical protein